MRPVWNGETSKWWLCVADVVAAVVDTNNPRIYWATVKRRSPQLFTNCKQLKMVAQDGKSYKTAVIDDNQLTSLIALVKSCKKDVFVKWLDFLGNSVDEKSKKSIRALRKRRIVFKMFAIRKHLRGCRVKAGRKKQNHNSEKSTPFAQRGGFFRVDHTFKPPRAARAGLNTGRIFMNFAE